MDSAITTIIIVCLMMLLFITEWLPIAATSILACLALAVFGVVPITTAFSGFGNDMLFLIAGMIIIGNALIETGVAQLLGKKIISIVGTNEWSFDLALIAVTTIVSLFISNTATLAIMLPIATSAINESGGKLLKKNTYMMLGIATVVTGGLTLIGSTPQLIAHSLLSESGYGTISFFEISKIGLPVFIIMIIYFRTIGRKLQQKFFTFEEQSTNTTGIDSISHKKENTKHTKKDIAQMYISVAALIFCIVGFITGLWSMGIVAMLGAVICIAAGCISQKILFEKMDWTTIIIMACSFSLSAALDQSGAGRLIAQSVVNLLGYDVSPIILCAALSFVAMLLTNFMSSTATAALLVPIAALVAIELDLNVKSVVIATAVAINLGFTTPISTPPITMTLSGGYRFKDYIVVGGCLNLLSYILIVILLPIIYRFV